MHPGGQCVSRPPLEHRVHVRPNSPAALPSQDPLTYVCIQRGLEGLLWPFGVCLENPLALGCGEALYIFNSNKIFTSI